MIKHYFWLACISSLLVACDEKATDVVDTQQTPRAVKVISVKDRSLAQNLQFSGIVRADRVADLAFDIGGRLDKLQVTEGQTISAGASIAELDLEVHELQLREAKVQRGIAQRHLKRAEKLYADRSLSQADIEDARAALDLRDIAVDQAIERLADRRLMAPFSGEIARRFVDAHTQIRAGQAVVRLQDLTHIRIEASIPAHVVATRDMQDVQQLSASFDFLPDQQFPLSVVEHHGESTPTAQTFVAIFRMPSPQGVNIRPGMTATVQLQLHEQDRHVYKLPLSAVRAENEKDFFVWRVDKENEKVESVHVELVAIHGKWATVRSTRLADQRIVSSGASLLHEGQRVRVLDDSDD